MTNAFLGKTANEVWKQAMKQLLLEENCVDGRNGKTKELLHTFITVEEPRQKWVQGRVPSISISFALAELVWIMNGEDRSDVINYWNPRLPQFAGKGSQYYGAYGKRMRSHFGFDQLKRACSVLQNCPDSRQVVIQIYDVVKDLPIEDGMPRSEDIPCNVCSILKVRNGRLEWTQILRSNDIYLGLPYNFIQFMSLQEIMAGWLQLEMGTYNHYSDSLHFYMKDTNKVGISEQKEIKNLDNLSLKIDDSEKIFAEIFQRMKYLTKSDISMNEIRDLGNLGADNQAYNNIMIMIAAYVANKSNAEDLTKELLDNCTNDLFIEMWNGWKNGKMK